MVDRKLHPHHFFSKEEKERIVAAIREAESATSGEIRVYLERKAKGHVMEHAKKVFEKIGMTKTKRRNGVLIYLSLKDRSFAILGDRGIHEQVGDNFWKETAAAMQEFFSREDFAGGLESIIKKIGLKLKSIFPKQQDDTNELPDSLMS